MKSTVSAIAASILTALAFAPASLAGSVFATATTSAPSAHIDWHCPRFDRRRRYQKD